MVGKRKALSNGEKDQLFKSMRDAYDNALNILTAEKPLTASVFHEVYRKHFGKYSFPALHGTPKSRPQYDENLYPSLFSDLEILGPEGGNAWDADQLPASLDELRKTIRHKNDASLARALLAFIWKQGDLNTLMHMISGLRGDSPSSSAVMWQFGKHLKDPLDTPIFDQHTSRARLLLVCFDDWKDRSTLLTVYKARLPKGQKLNNTPMLDAYLEWWQLHINKNLPREPRNDRALAILWSDRLMFSLGKAAKGVVARL